jgi:hypothetical protein
VELHASGGRATAGTTASSTTPSTCSTSTATICAPSLRFSEHIAGNGGEMFAHAAKLN